MHKYIQEVAVNAPIDEVFTFFNNPLNLSKIMPPFITFKILTPGPLETKVGAIFDYQVSILGIPQRWQSYISDYDPPYQFVDIQLKGPHAYWHHRHRFKESGSQTIVIDELTYQLPLSIIGKLANLIVMKPMIKALFSYRSDYIETYFQSCSTSSDKEV